MVSLPFCALICQELFFLTCCWLDASCLRRFFMRAKEIWFSANRTRIGDGIAVIVCKSGSLRFEMNGIDSRGKRQTIAWNSDADQMNGSLQRFSIVVDDNPRVMMFYTNGRINDGEGQRDHGWRRYWLAPQNLRGTGTLRIHPSIRTLRISDRSLQSYEL
jgi:hypothetical protein